MNKEFIHPEVLPDVISEFKRLRKDNPKSDARYLWNTAREYVLMVETANSNILRELIHGWQ